MRSYSRSKPNYFSELQDCFVVDVCQGKDNIVALAVPCNSPAKQVFLQHGVIGSALNRRSYMHSLIVKGIAAKRIKGKSANMVNGEWISARTALRKSKMLIAPLPEESRATSPRGSTFRLMEPMTGQDSVVSTNRQNELSHIGESSAPLDRLAKKKSFRINLENRPEDSAPKETSFLFPGYRPDAAKGQLSEGNRLLKEAKEIHKSPDISIFANPQSRHGRSVDSKANPLAELGFSNEMSLNLRDRGITFRDCSLASDFHTERESRPESSTENFEKAVHLLNLNPDLLNQKLNVSGFKEYSHLTDEKDSSNNLSTPFSEYGPDFYNQIASMILADPDLREKSSKLTKDPNDIFRQGIGSTRKIFMELVESGNVKQIFSTILKNILTPKQLKGVSTSIKQVLKNYRARQKNEEEFKAIGPVTETKQKCLTQRSFAVDQVKRLELINSDLMQGVIGSIEGIAKNKKICHELLKVVVCGYQKPTAVRPVRIPEQHNIMKRNIAEMTNTNPTVREVRQRQKLDSLHRSFAEVQARKNLQQSAFSISLQERLSELKEKDKHTKERIHRELFKRKNCKALKQLSSFVVCLRFFEAVSQFLASSIHR